MCQVLWTFGNGFQNGATAPEFGKDDDMNSLRIRRPTRSVMAVQRAPKRRRHLTESTLFGGLKRVPISFSFSTPFRRKLACVSNVAQKSGTDVITRCLFLASNAWSCFWIPSDRREGEPRFFLFILILFLLTKENAASAERIINERKCGAAFHLSVTRIHWERNSVHLLSLSFSSRDWSNDVRKDLVAVSTLT